MSLPMNSMPVYTLTIPSTKKEFKYRPFLVKDEKALLIAQQSEDINVMLDTIKSVIKSCAISEINIDKLASFDVEYIFCQLRSVSVGEIVELLFRCDDCENEEAVSKVAINLQNVKVEERDNHSNKIKLFGDVGVVMSYPTIEVLKKIQAVNTNDFDQIIDIIINCMDYVYDSEEIFYAKEEKKEVLVEFLNNLTSSQFENIQNFFTTMPQLRAYVDYSCPICAKDHHKYMEGIQSFFSLH